MLSECLVYDLNRNTFNEYLLAFLHELTHSSVPLEVRNTFKDVPRETETTPQVLQLEVEELAKGEGHSVIVLVVVVYQAYVGRGADQ
jgi:hypothetical protein